MDDHQAYLIKHVQSEDWPISINSGTFHEEDPSPAPPSSSSVCSGSARAFPTPPNQDEPLNYNSHLHTPTQYGLTKETSLPQANMNAQNNSKKFEGLRQHPSEARIDSSAQIRDLYNRDNETPFGSPLLGKSTVSMSVLHSSGSFSGSFRALKNAAEPSINTEVAWRRLRTHLHDEFEDTELVLLDWTTLHSVVRHIGITDPLEIARIQIAWRQRQQRYLMLPVPQRSSHPGISELEPTFPISQPKRERSVVNASASGVSLGNALTKSQSFRSGSNDRGRELGRTLSLSTATTHALLHGKLSVKTAEKSISDEVTHVNDNSCAMESHHDGIRVNDVVRTNSYYAPYGTASARTSVDEEEGIRPYESVKPVVAQNHHYTSQRTREASVDAHAPVRHQRSMTKSQSQRQRVVVSNSNDSHHDALRSDQSLTPPDGALSRLQSGVTRTNTTSWGSALRSISNLHPTSSQTHKSPMRTSGTMSSLQQRSPPQRKKAASRDVSPLMHVVPRRNFTSNTTTTTTVHRGIASDAPVVGSTGRFGTLRGGRLGQYSHSPQLTTSNNISNFSGHVRKDIHRKR